ncbi:3'-5' exonuclease [Gluconobacter albidus]|uniref:3'-5' exonuclease n=1 Tax=Gluconobacter albidus TaxID=318683 RepID=UPI00209D88F3|nr:3'-5' exonuclease [Gluconobacter albidus]MCP1272514.1 3'-5' exonuclease [Gluconobacter albidus]
MHVLLLFLLIILLLIWWIAGVIERKLFKDDKTPGRKGPVSPDTKIPTMPCTLKKLKNPIFLDVETTGLHSDDGIVSIAMIRIDNLNSHDQRVYHLNLIFDPLKKSHPMAEKIHGMDDWTIRHQPLFEQHVNEILDFLSPADGIVCHNAKFDISFLQREIEKSGRQMPKIQIQCTMEEARSRGFYSASLSNCASRLGQYRFQEKHNAMEDAILCMKIWLNFQGINHKNYNILSGKTFENYISPPHRPDVLPRRNNKRKKLTSCQPRHAEE